MRTHQAAHAAGARPLLPALAGARQCHQAKASGYLPPSAGLSARLAAGVLVAEVLVKLVIRLNQHDIAATAEGLLIRAQASDERVKLGIGIVGVGINASGLRITFTPENLRLPEGVGLDYRHLPVGRRANTFGKLLPLGAQFPCLFLPLF